MRLAVALTLVAAALLAAGCTGSDSGGTTNDVGSPPASPPQGIAAPQPHTQHVTVNGRFDKALLYDPKEFTVISGGQVTIVLDNEVTDGTSHNFVIDGVANVKTTAAGSSNSQTFTAPAPGSYTFYCTITGHRAMGLEGTMTVAVS